ncbi:MAG: prepilin-type N-terminal cleavage/methylation domain-containing protein [Bdellovibrionales bacterium]|nr:prepilin-type N-terminal cleavage/methylation domain-containing protein [Bdellovibrionales bacterium]
MLSNQKLDSGFTLIEVTLAIVILAGSLTILLGLQSAIIDRTVRDNNQKQAVMIARLILAAIESEEASGNPLPLQQTTAPIDDVLQSILSTPFELPQTLKLEPFEATLLVAYAGIPGVAEEALKRIDLTISWGESNQERLDVVLFIPFDEKENA